VQSHGFAALLGTVPRRYRQATGLFVKQHDGTYRRRHRQFYLKTKGVQNVRDRLPINNFLQGDSLDIM